MNTARTTRRRRIRASRRRDDTGSLAIAMLVVVVGMGIAALLMPMVLRQIGTTTYGDSRAGELTAAEAGTSVALGLIRSATDDTGSGVATELPCTTDAAITGTVDGTAGNLRYSVRLAYFTGPQNPRGQTGSWLDPYTKGGPGHAMICSSGHGVYYPPEPTTTVPSFVLIVSTGSDARTSRTLRSTYYVQTTNANVSGGTIYVFPPSGATTKYCVDAGSAQPIAGTTVKLAACADDLIQQQAWAYNTDLSIQLVSSVTSAYPNGLCLSAMDDDGKQQSAGDLIQLQKCATVGSAPWNQMWSVDDVAHLEGANPSATDVDGLCIQAGPYNSNTKGSPPYPGAGSVLQLSGCVGSVEDPFQTWVPSPDVGAGQAGATNKQVVNFQQFGRCLDVTGADPSQGFLIAYTCKQNPDPSQVLWNQKFTVDPSGRWVTHDTANNTDYCLTSPLTQYTGGSSGPWVSLTPCSQQATGTTWARYDATDPDDDPLPAAQQYTIVDSAGDCLSLTTDTSVAFNGQYSKVVVEKCDGSPLQKWNASADLQVPQLKDMTEIANPTTP